MHWRWHKECANCSLSGLYHFKEIIINWRSLIRSHPSPQVGSFHRSQSAKTTSLTARLWKEKFCHGHTSEKVDWRAASTFAWISAYLHRHHALDWKRSVRFWETFCHRKDFPSGSRMFQGRGLRVRQSPCCSNEGHGGNLKNFTPLGKKIIRWGKKITISSCWRQWVELA